MAKLPGDTRDFFKQEVVEEPKPRELNIAPVAEGSVVNQGVLKSPNFVHKRSGWRVNSQGGFEANDGEFRGTFSIGGTQVTIDNQEDLQTELNNISTEGGGTLFLKAGTYTLTADISIPSGVTLEGASRDGVIIDCNSSYAVKIAGTNPYTTGTISATNGDATITGSGTTWTSAMAGRYILVDGFYYEIDSVTDTTHLELTYAFDGSNQSGAGYAIADVNFVTGLKDVTVTNATGSAVVVQYANEPTIDNVYVDASGTGFDIDYSVYPKLEFVATECGVGCDFNYMFGFKIDFSEASFTDTGAGMIFTNCADATVFDSTSFSNTGDGMTFTDCNDITLVSISLNDNGGQGVELVSGNTGLVFMGVTADGNTSDGYKLTATSDRITISNCFIVNNGGYGVNIAASTCDDNYIVAPAFSNNTSGDINDDGTGTKIIEDTTSNFSLGDGADGDVTISSGTTTLTSDMFYNTLTINGTGVLDTAGYAVYVKGKLLLDGSSGALIRNNGGDGGDASGTTGGTAGTAPAGVTVPPGIAGQAGASGRSTAGGGGQGVNGTASAFSMGVAGTGGGQGGSTSSFGTGGGSTGGSQTATHSVVTVSDLAFSAYLSGTVTVFTGSSGSGSGGGGSNEDGTGTSGGGGGSGGTGGTVLVLAAEMDVTTASSIQATGGDGGAGADGASGNNAGGGGGAGGSGGVVIVGYVRKINLDAPSVAGGAGGAKGSPSGSGNDDAVAGTAGGTGVVYEIQL